MSIRHQKRASKYRMEKRSPYGKMQCPECGKQMRLANRRGGAELWRCPKCGEEVTFTYEEADDGEKNS